MFRKPLYLGLLFVMAVIGILLSQLLRVPAVVVLPEASAVLPIETTVMAMATATAFNQPVSPLPLTLSLDQRKVELGRRLFNDRRLSRGERFSCASCHDLKLGGADGQPQSIGQDGQPLMMNSPTILNSAYNFRQFWDGRAVTLEDQVNHPLNATNELGQTWADVMGRLQQDADYKTQFTVAYGNLGMKPETIRDALATFERALITPSRFDQFLRGNKAALAAQEQVGYDKFNAYGCVACHQGVNLGGNMFQSLGVMVDYFSTQGEPKPADQGRMAVTGDVRDRHVFKVPTLRNIGLTAPYLHDGHVATLPEVVRIMARHQLGREMPDQDVTDLVAFLNSLSGDVPQVLAR